MNKRVVAAVVAVLLAVVGVAMLLNYASDADQRAFEGTKRQAVLQVKEAIPANTPAEDLGPFVAKTEMPAIAVAKGAVSDLGDLAGLENTVDLEPGEQLILARFAKPGASKSTSKSEVPEGMQEVTVALDASQTVASRIQSGDRVGILATAPRDKADKNTVAGFVLDQVLVTHVDKAAAASEQQGGILITFALTSEDVKRVVYAAEHLKIWLTRQNDATAKDIGNPIVPKDVLK